MRIKYSIASVKSGRRHYLTAGDVEVLLSRLPASIWVRLREVHFNDCGRGGRTLGYVNMSLREIAICALPAQVSLTRACVSWRPTKFQRHRSPRQFGAIRGCQWPQLAVRRFLVYCVFLHELGHLQVIDAKARRVQRRFASETKAEEFADEWRAR